VTTDDSTRPTCTTHIPILNDVYFDAHSSTPDSRFEDDRYFYDPSDDYTDDLDTRNVFHLALDSDGILHTVVDQFLTDIPTDELLGMHEPFDTYAYGLRTAITMQHAAKLQPFLGYRPLEVVRRTLEVTTQLGATVNYHNLKAHLKMLLPWANKTRLNETVSTDTIFADKEDVSGATCAQVFYGLSSHVFNIYGMSTESEGPNRLNDFVREEGIPMVLQSDNSKMQRRGLMWLQ
jgi:hypothetical protein